MKVLKTVLSFNLFGNKQNKETYNKETFYRIFYSIN